MYWTLKSLGDSNTTLSTNHPSSITPKPILFKDKEKFRKWCVDPKTNHTFYSLNEGLNPHNRISSSNPAFRMHGFVGDYDGDVDTSDMLALSQAIASKAAGSWCPTWLSKTFSKRARVVWEFEKPLFIDNEQLCSSIYDELVKVTKCRTLIAKGGWDEGSLNPAMFWELGSEWTPISTASVSEMATERLFFDCAKKTGSPRGRVNIPMEVVASQVHDLFPGRWIGDFVEGSRGPLFWIDDGIDRVGCIVQEGGMWCYSSRAGKSFVPWVDIFGEKFISEYREKQLAEAIEDTWFDGKKYWIKDGRDTWAPTAKEDFMMRLRLAGFSHKGRKQNDPASQIDEVLVYVQDHRRIHGAAPFLFNFEEIVEQNHRKYINTHAHVRVMEPAADGDPKYWPNLFNWWHNWLDDNASAAYFFTWFKRFYEGALAGQPNMGHSLIIAGDADKGKSLFSTFLLPLVFGGGADCGKYLMGLEKFNGELTEKPVWYIDDNISCANHTEHKRFSEMLKKMSATPKITSRVMYSEPVDLDHIGRIIMTTNTDADSLSILPNLDGTILDKLMIFKMNSRHKPWFLQRTQHEIETTLKNELPHALRYLLDYAPPKEIVHGASGRYGMHAYHHKDIISIAKDLSPDQRDWEMLQFWWSVRNDKNHWHGNVSALMGELEMYENLRVFTRSMNKVVFGRTMAKLADFHPKQITKKLVGNVVEYQINLNE